MTLLEFAGAGITERGTRMSSTCIVVCVSWYFYCPVLGALCAQLGVCSIEDLISSVKPRPVRWRTGWGASENLDGIFLKVKALSHCRDIKLGEVSSSSTDALFPKDPIAGKSCHPS